MPYRDGLDAMRREVMERRQAVFEEARRFGDAHRAVLADGGAAVEAMHDRAMVFLEGEIATVEAGSEALAVLEALRMAYGEARGRGDTLLHAEPLDADVPDVALDPRDFCRSTVADVGPILASVLVPYGGANDVTTLDIGMRARFRVDEAPFSIAVGTCERDDERVPRFELVTTVPRLVRAFRLRVEGGVDGILRAVGVRREHRIGALYFDASFWIEGDRPGAVAALGPAAQEALLACVDRDPELRLEAGLARLAWTSPAPAPDELTMPIAALLAVRRALAGGHRLGAR